MSWGRLCCFALLLVGCVGQFDFLRFSQEEASVKNVQMEAGKVPGLVLDPIVVLPGTPGSYLEAKLTHVEPPHWYCKKNSDWFKVWINPELFIPGFSDCIEYYLKLHYNETSNTFSNSTGVEIRPVDYGGFNGTYFTNMVSNFSKLAGYEVGKTIFGAPFDWRVAGVWYSLYGSYNYLKNLVEHAYNVNNGSRVHLLGHSGGGPYGYYFLRSFVSRQWKDKYIKTYITMGAPWLGSATASAFFANFSAIVPANAPPAFLKVYDILGKSTALAVSFLPPEKFTSSDVLISTAKRNYTGAQSLDLLKDSNSTPAYAIRKNNMDYFNNLPAPQTELHCIYGFGFPTAVSYEFSSADFSQLKKVINTDGDSVVAMKSLSFCTSFRAQQAQPVHFAGFYNVSHSVMQDSPDIWYYILNVTTHKA